MRLLSTTLMWLALIACAPLVHAQAAQPVYRCIGAHGEPEFSGQPCATPAPPATAGSASLSIGAGPGSACAASPAVLRQAIAQAFAARDVNRLTGLMLWRGVDQASARAVMRSLSAFMQRPLTGIADVRAGGAAPPDALPAPAATAPPAGGSGSAPPPVAFAVSTGGVEGSTRDFSLAERGGCWWLTP